MSNKTIEPIFANSTNKNETYRLLNMIHVMAGRCAVNKVDQWELSSAHTYPDDVMTTWTNGIVDVKAHSHHGVHYYSMTQCIDEEQKDAE